MVKNFIGISRKDFLLKFFDLWNVLMPEGDKLTTKESLMLAEIMTLPDKYRFQGLSTHARKYLLKTVNETGWKLSAQGLTQIIKSLSDKGVLQKDPDGLKYINPALNILTDEKQKEYELRFNFKLV